jgi:hypothetical protein
MPTATGAPAHAAVYALISSWTVWRDWFARRSSAIADCYAALLLLAVEVRDARLALLQERLALAHLAAAPSAPAAAHGSSPSLPSASPPASPSAPWGLGRRTRTATATRPTCWARPSPT